MNTLGVGIDLVDVDRVKLMLDRKEDYAVRKLLTDDEQEYCFGQPVPAQHVAARVAAKEAAYKAFQLNDRARGIGWRELEVRRSAAGIPSLEFHGLAAQIAAELNVTKALISMSHSSSQASAVVILLAD